MSLFRVKELWSTDVGAGEEFNEGALCVDNLNGNSGSWLNCYLIKILLSAVIVMVGSLNGTLRVFKPHAQSFRPEDQLLVVDLKMPLLQIEVGHFLTSLIHLEGKLKILFLGSTKEKAVAVLHPACLSLFSMEVVSDMVKHKEILSIQFQRPVANMACGCFGRKRGACCYSEKLNSHCLQAWTASVFNPLMARSTLWRKAD